MGKRLNDLRSACKDYQDLQHQYFTQGQLRSAEKNMINAAMCFCGYYNHKGEWKKKCPEVIIRNSGKG